MDEDKSKDCKPLVEEIEVAGENLIDKIKALFKEGNVRQLRLWVEGGDFSLELPMTVGAIAGGAVVLTAPWLAILGVIAALVAKVRIEVERDDAASTADKGTTAPDLKPSEDTPVS